MRTRHLLLNAIITMAMLSSCENIMDYETSVNEKAAHYDANVNPVSIDSLELYSWEPIEETEELKKFKEYLKNKKGNLRSLTAYSSYDENYYSNIYAIRELPVTLYARGQANTSNRYLSCDGKDKEVKLVASATSNKQKFYLKVLPASSGIPYLIYSQESKTPLVVGYYTNNPNNKILFANPDDNGSLYSASWDLIPSQTSKGYFAIESQSYLGQSDPNNWWSVFNYVIEVKNDNLIGYSQYTNKPQQEFLLKPDATFQLQEVTFNANSAVISPASDIAIVSTSVNPSVEPKNYTISVNKQYNETSYFSENPSDISFNIGNLTKLFKRPTVQANRIVLPESSTPTDATYRTTSIQNISKMLSFNINGNAPENCLIEVTSYIKTYNVSINYTVKAKYSDREIQFSGIWRGYVISDPNLAKPTHIARFFDLDTGDEIYYFSPSSIETTIN